MSKTLLKSTATVGGMTMISRVLGLVRDMVIARAFGAGMGADAFFVAFKIPNFLRRLFAEGAFSQAFVPVLSEYKAQRSHREVHQLVDHVVGVLGGALFLVTLVGVLAAPVLVMIFAPGFLAEPTKFALTVDMIRLTFPYLLFISLTALAGGVLNSFGRFGVPAFTPVFLNLSLIATTLWLAPRMAEPVTALAWGVLLAGVVQLLFQLPYLQGLRLLPWPRFSLRDAGVRQVARLMLPGIFGSSVAQINLLFDTLIASFLVTGSVSWLYYSDRLMEFPLGVFGIALATVMLPRLSLQHAKASVHNFSRTLDWALRWVVLIGTPAAGGLMALAAPLLMTLFQYGAFDFQDVQMARLSLMAYALGLPGFILVKVLAPGFYARQDTRTPVRIGVIAMLANMVMNVAFVVPMVIWKLPGPHAGLALATSLAAFLNAGLLYRRLRRDACYQPGSGWPLLLLRVGLATLGMVLVLQLGVGELALWHEREWPARLGHLLLWVLAGGLSYAGCLWLCGLRWRHLQVTPGN